MMRRISLFVLPVLLVPFVALGIFSPRATAQEPAPAQELAAEPLEPVAQQALRVFLDCGACDFDYTRRTILFVDWVRDRVDAQVHALVTAQATGSGGAEYRVNLIGQQEFEGEGSVSRYTSVGTDTRQEVREGLVHTLHLALVRFTAGTPLGGRIRVVYEPLTAEEAAPAEPEDDPWNFWVFSVGLDGSFSGEEATTFSSISGALTANRTTEDWKLRFAVRGSYSEDTFELSEDDEFLSISRRIQATGLAVRSLGGHWSTGLRYTAATSTFSNTDLSLRLAPAVEYSIFPYAESSERDLRFLYSVGVNRLNYEEETIFSVTEETLFDHNLTFAIDLVQPWGSAQVSLEGSTLLNDFSQHQFGIDVSSDWRIFRGLSLILFGGVSRIANQRNLSAGGVTDEEILLRRRELATSFRYFATVGFGYTFGSKFANVVNPRLGI